MSRDIVLIVDDEPVLLRMCSIAVAQAGFRPVVAENGAAGLEAFMILKGDICLLLSDIIMPAMNGLQLSETILRIAPGMKIPLMSGYSDEVIEVQGRNRFPFIRKPFIYRILIEKVRAIIETDADAATSSR